MHLILIESHQIDPSSQEFAGHQSSKSRFRRQPRGLRSTDPQAARVAAHRSCRLAVLIACQSLGHVRVPVSAPVAGAGCPALVVPRLICRRGRSSLSSEAVQIQAEVRCCSTSRRPARTPGKLEDLGIDWVSVSPYDTMDASTSRSAAPRTAQRVSARGPRGRDDKDHGGGRRPDDMSSCLPTGYEVHVNGSVHVDILFLPAAAAVCVHLIQ